MTSSKSPSLSKIKTAQTDKGKAASVAETDSDGAEEKTGEIGGPKGPEPTRYGDWEKKGRCSDF